MKLAGMDITVKNEKIIPIVRPGNTYYFMTKAIDDYEVFEELVPRPKPKKVGAIVGQKAAPLQDAEFLDELADYNLKFTDFLVISSLHSVAFMHTSLDEEGNEVTKRVKTEITWDDIAKTNPDTWSKWEDELKKFGLNNAELNLVRTGCLETNSLTDKLVQEALDDFLLHPPVDTLQVELSSPAELGITPSGTPVSD